MCGYTNTNKNGEYLSLEVLGRAKHNLIASTKAMQETLTKEHNVLFEGHPIDNKGKNHMYCVSESKALGSYVGVNAKEAGAIVSSSDIFFINGYAVCTSGTKKYQNRGNCPISSMLVPTTAKSIFYVAE